MLDILALQTSSSHPTLITVMYSVLLSFLLSTMIAITYEKTFRGLSYSRNYMQAIILSAIVAASIMQAIGDSLASGLGMMGALAIIRFRTSFRDPRDIIFMFAALGAGIACGVNGYHIAIVGTAGFCSVAFILYFSPFGRTSCFDGMLRFNIENDARGKALLEEILKKYCHIFALITLRDMAQGKRLDYAYQVKLKKGEDKAALVAELNRIESIRGVSVLLQETTVEL
jgi:uncharacterized membrane protein YhiD involved in acid resistance